MSNVIGIISWLPDNKEIREHRFTKLKRLIFNCNHVFSNTPIIIVAQDWTELEKQVFNKYSNIKIESFPKLGIVGARNKLRELFLNSTYDYLIMLDDDLILDSTQCSGNSYLSQLKTKNPSYLPFYGSLLWLFAIHRDLLAEIDFDPNINPEDGTGFEDRIFLKRVEEKFIDKKINYFDKNLKVSGIATRDADSTWYNNQDLKQMLINTAVYKC